MQLPSTWDKSILSQFANLIQGRLHTKALLLSDPSSLDTDAITAMVIKRMEREYSFIRHESSYGLIPIIDKFINEEIESVVAYRCINNAGIESRFTIGETYKLKGQNKGLLSIVNNDDEIEECFPDRFEEIMV